MNGDWGEIKLEKINDGADFWHLIGELIDDNSNFFINKNKIVESYKEGTLYGLRVCETDKMFERSARMDEIFCQDSWYLLPCFCVKENDVAIIIWTHSRARKNGFASKLVKLLQIKHVFQPLSSSVEFWNKCGIPEIKNYNFSWL